MSKVNVNPAGYVDSQVALEKREPTTSSSASSDRSHSSAKKTGCCAFGGRYRYLVLLVAVLCLTSICSNMIAFNFTVIVMDKPNKEYNVLIEEAKSKGTNFNITGVSARVPYTKDEKAQLMYTIGLASIAGTFPFSMMYTRFGARKVFTLAGLISTVSTALIPIVAEMGMGPFLIVRVFQGLSYSANFAAIGVICSRWASLRQHGFFLSCMTNFTSLASMITNPVAALLSSLSHSSWHWVYYTHAAATPLLFALWMLVYRDQPQSSSCVGDKEREKIERNKSKLELENQKRMSLYVYKEICTHPAILAVWLNAFFEITTSVFILTYMPIYASSVLGYDLKKTGFYSALPAVSHVPLKIFLGWFFDSLKCMSEVNKMRLANTIAVWGTGLCFAVVGFIPDEYPFMAILVLTLHHAFASANCGGFYKCGTFVSRQYAHFVVAGIQFLKSLTMFVSPLLVKFFVETESDKTEWRQIFLGMAISLFLVNIVFFFAATDKAAKFTKLPRENIDVMMNGKELKI